MSIVKYKVGSKDYSFCTELQIANMLTVETVLIEEIKNHIVSTIEKNVGKGKLIGFWKFTNL